MLTACYFEYGGESFVVEENRRFLSQVDCLVKGYINICNINICNISVVSLTHHSRSLDGGAMDSFHAAVELHSCDSMGTPRSHFCHT